MKWGARNASAKIWALKPATMNITVLYIPGVRYGHLGRTYSLHLQGREPFVASRKTVISLEIHISAISRVHNIETDLK
jgi:hypothetical protein